MKQRWNEVSNPVLLVLKGAVELIVCRPHLLASHQSLTKHSWEFPSP